MCRPDRIPAQPEAQAGLYRSLLADKRMLIVLDNARDEQQVRPLLPASPASLVLVTSRNQLAGLAAADGARLLTLDVLTDAEAVQLLTARLGAGRVAAEPDAVAEIASLCAWLPLALAVAAARAAARPGFPLAVLAAELRDCGRPPGRAGYRRPGGQRPGRVLLVLPAAQPRGGADVPAAGPAPRPGHHRCRRRQPRRQQLSPRPAACWASWPART